MKYLVILDNGEDYSDHVHIPILVCDTEEQANTYIGPFADYVERRKAAYMPVLRAKRGAWNAEYAKFDVWAKQNPSPIPLPKGFRMDNDVHMSVLPVPEYLS